MPNELIWSPLAKQDLKETIEYLYDNWNERIAIHFLNKVEIVTIQITKHPQLFPVINEQLQVRKCVVTKQNSLFYRISNDKIDILRLYDTRQDPRKLKFK